MRLGSTVLWSSASVAVLFALAAGVALFRPALRETGESPPEAVILVVLDTVRAETTSLCGDPRPTTPVLASLRAAGWSATCSAYAPGTWTVPSHASFFTGRPVVELEAGRFVPLAAETLTGRLRARGYRTAMVSANMVLRKPGWLSAGFDHVTIAGSFDELDGTRLAEAVDAALAEVPADAPLFLFVNVAEAHAPYPAVPDGVGWVPPQRAVQHRMWAADADTPFKRYVSGRMPAEEAERYRERLANGYAWAVHQADASLGRVLERVEAHGRLARARVVVTSDHGEFVGEHGQVGHGDTLFEPGVRVPFLYRDFRSDRPVVLPEPLDARLLFPLLLDGALPDPVPAPVTLAFFQPSARESWDGAASWTTSTDKLLWRDGAWERFDLGADPGERDPRDVAGAPGLQAFEALVGRHVESLRALPEVDDDTTSLLRAAGYVE